ncbi:MAG: ParB/RepB/Spo0J family partition protein [Bacteroidia bacterium]|nr:ParB/RepB/Spo0J family partition protein [Bacteroidia bacterium]
MSANKRNALGKGLSALLENANTDITSSSKSTEGSTAVAGGIAEIPVSQIEANPFQPRTKFEKEALAELAESISSMGIIQPVTVRKIGYDRYQLISGERRFKASQVAGLQSIPAYIRIANDEAMLEMALVENIQRENLDAIEIAISYKRLMDECGLTQESLSKKVGKQRSTIANYLRLLKLPAEVQLAIRENKISMGHARAIVNIDKNETLLEIANRIISEELSVREVEDLVRWQNKKPESLRRTRKSAAFPLPDKLKKVNESLKVTFGKKTELRRQNNGKGKIIIPFLSDDDLERILTLLDIL